jgi:hypothetical protein
MEFERSECPRRLLAPPPQRRPALPHPGSAVGAASGAAARAWPQLTVFDCLLPPWRAPAPHQAPASLTCASSRTPWTSRRARCGAARACAGAGWAEGRAEGAGAQQGHAPRTLQAGRTTLQSQQRARGAQSEATHGSPPDAPLRLPSHPPKVRDTATDVPASYTPPDFFSRALQHTDPTLTWDETGRGRKKVGRRGRRGAAAWLLAVLPSLLRPCPPRPRPAPPERHPSPKAQGFAAPRRTAPSSP